MTKPIERTNDCSNRQKPCEHGPMHNYWCCFVHQDMPDFSARKCSPGIIPKGVPQSAGGVPFEDKHCNGITCGGFDNGFNEGLAQYLAARPPSTGQPETDIVCSICNHELLYHTTRKLGAPGSPARCFACVELKYGNNEHIFEALRTLSASTGMAALEITAVIDDLRWVIAKLNSREDQDSFELAGRIATNVDRLAALNDAPQAAGDVFHSDPDIELTDGAADEFIEAMQPPAKGLESIREIINDPDLEGNYWEQVDRIEALIDGKIAGAPESPDAPQSTGESTSHESP